MALEQTRAKDLALFDEISTGVSVSNLYILVDHPDLPKAMKYYFSSGGTSLHIEQDTLTNLSSHAVTVEFNEAFSFLPMLTHFAVYRWEDILNDGYWKKKNVEWHYASSSPWTTEEFYFIIDDTEDLSGVIVEYKFE
jgi:hypothetical protein